MSARSRKPSPVLGAAAILIEEADNTFVAGTSRFKHSFEASIETIDPDPEQARKTFDEGGLRALAETMQAEGQLQPVLVRRAPREGRRWILVAGERRWRAAKLIGWKTILAIEFDGDPEVASLLENLQRVDLAPREEASALQRLIDGKGWTQLQAAEALGKTKSEVSGVLKILSLPEEVLNVLTSEHPVARSVLIELARLPDGAARRQLIKQAQDGRLTVKAIRLSKNGRSEEKPDKISQSEFNFTMLERVAARLNHLRSVGTKMNEVNRSRLLHLRLEIDALLDLS